MGTGDFDLWTAKPDRALQDFSKIRSHAKSSRLPWRMVAGGIKEELRTISNEGDAEAARRFPLRSVSHLPERLFRHKLRRRFNGELKEASTSALYRTAPTASAARLLTLGQKFGFSLLILICAAAFAITPLATLIALNSIVTIYFIAVIFFRLYLAIIAMGIDPADHAQPTPLKDADLPVITILLPLFGEAGALPILSRAIGALDYPVDKMDVKLILEECDQATIAEARRLGLDRCYEMIIVPLSFPQTKPKACNHGLYLARGSLTAIYDAEDVPDPDQLRKAAAAFHGAPGDLACVQARLNYYNADENWLSRLFSLEYALWFDSLLPALEKLNSPIPLGGTSNFFRTDTLIKIGGWDPFNVTEDADLGLRLARLGYRTEIIDSTTFEEANCQIGNWLRQRSRWMKGYMQTWLVHMREPFAFYQVAGWRGVTATHLFVAGNVFNALINPILWTVFTIWLLTGSSAIAAIFPGPLLALNLFALLAGNFLFIYLAMIAPLKRGWPELSPAALLAPAYWWLTSIAAYKAVWQLMTRPSFWEKTDHVTSAAAKTKRNDALATIAKSAKTA